MNLLKSKNVDVNILLREPDILNELIEDFNSRLLKKSKN